MLIIIVATKGFEPLQPGPKPDVLPLHQMANLVLFNCAKLSKKI